MKVVRMLLILSIVGLTFALVSAPTYAAENVRGVACDVLLDQIFNTPEPGKSLEAHCRAYFAPHKCPFNAEVARICLQQKCNRCQICQGLLAEFKAICLDKDAATTAASKSAATAASASAAAPAPAPASNSELSPRCEELVAELKATCFGDDKDAATAASNGDSTVAGTPSPAAPAPPAQEKKAP